MRKRSFKDSFTSPRLNTAASHHHLGYNNTQRDQCFNLSLSHSLEMINVVLQGHRKEEKETEAKQKNI